MDANGTYVILPTLCIKIQKVCYIKKSRLSVDTYVHFSSCVPKQLGCA